MKNEFLWFSSFYKKWIFMICLIKWYLFWASLIIFMKNANYMILVHSHFICLFMTTFHDHFELYGPLSVKLYVFSMVHDIHMIWFHVFEGSLTSFQKLSLTSYYSSFGSVFTIKIFSNSICENPFQHHHGRMDGRVCLVSLIEKSFILSIKGW